MPLKAARPLVHLLPLEKDCLPAVLAIEEECYAWEAWTERQFERLLDRPAVTGLVAVRGRRVVAFLLYARSPDHLRLLNLAVDPEYRRQWIGSGLLMGVQLKLKQDGRRQLVADVRESNTAAQLFFRACGMRATEVLRGYYGGEDGYRMVYAPFGAEV